MYYLSVLLVPDTWRRIDERRGFRGSPGQTDRVQPSSNVLPSLIYLPRPCFQLADYLYRDQYTNTFGDAGADSVPNDRIQLIVDFGESSSELTFLSIRRGLAYARLATLSDPTFSNKKCIQFLTHEFSVRQLLSLEGLRNEKDHITIVPSSKRTTKVVEMKSEPVVPPRHRNRSTCIWLPSKPHTFPPSGKPVFVNVE